MDYRKTLYLQIIVRSVLIACNAFLMILFAYQLDWIFTSIFLSLIFVSQIILLARYLNKTNRDLANFFMYLHENDTSINYLNHVFPERYKTLAFAFNEVNKKYKGIKNESRKKDILLNILVNEVHAGILITDKSEKVRIINKGFMSLFKTDDIISLNSLSPNLAKQIELVKKTNQQIITFLGKQILVKYQILKDENEALDLFVFHDIGKEMNEKELESYNGLIRVLSHEIMNTLTPLSTVVDTIFDCLMLENEPKRLSGLNQKDIDDACQSIQIIESRTGGLKEFVKRFRQFIHLPEPEYETIQVDQFFAGIITMFSEEVHYENQHVNTLIADKTQLQQVIINMLKNAIEATSIVENPQINLSINENQNQKIEITISDNGTGIPNDIIDNVFIPFFTTKENGSGIGLSLSRQIMYKHHGDLLIDSNQNGTTVTLILNK